MRTLRPLAAAVALALPFLCSVPPAAMAAPAVPAVSEFDVNASGVFLNAEGDVLTARHAVAHCRSLYAVKDAHVAEATVGALSPDMDIAVLHTSLKPYLSATFARSDAPRTSATGVFTEAYGVLQHLPDRAALLSNAMTIPGSEDMQMVSGAKPGASGSGVLGSSGLLLGVVVERVASGPGAATRMLSRAAAPSADSVGATQVRAITAAHIKQFLREQGIAFAESDEAQLGPMQSPAARAATLAVGVICG